MKQTLKNFQLVLLFIFSLNVIAQDEDVLFQAFDWNVQNQPAGQTWFNVVTQNSNEITSAGIDIIWLPPVSDSGAPQGYLPRELYNFNSAYGSETQLRNLINTYHNLGVKIIGDIVINHRVGTNDAVTFTNPAWPTTFITADDEGRNFVNYPVEFSINGDYFPGTALKADGSNGTYGPARDLDHKNPAVRQEIKNWMNFLKNDLGFDGWRYDFVHGYDPIYNKEYNDATNPYFAVGELLESSRVQTNNWVNFTQQSSSAFDFNTKVTLQNAFRDNNLSYLRDGGGNPSGMIGINPSKSVTFLENHDTGAAQQCCGPGYVFPSDETNIRKGYAYILTHPGNPMVFWTHYFDTGSGVRNAIKDLIAIRKDARIFAGSSINIAEARNDLYAAYIDGRNGTIAMKLGSGNWAPNGNGWVLRTSGTDYAIWTQGGTSPPPPTQVDPFTVNFKKPTSWSNNVNVYLFDASTNAIIPGTQGWPGQTMTAIAGTPWYSFNVNPPLGVTAQNIRVIFNDGTNQTDDLSRSTDGWYDNGTWTNTCPSNCTSTPPPPPTGNITVHFKKPTSWNSTINSYFFDASTNSTISGTQGWPGQSMSSISGTSWYKYTLNVPSGTSSNNIRVIFNDGANQTDDLARGSDGWYDNGIWTNSCPSDCSNTPPPPSTSATINFLRTSSWGNTVNAYLYNKTTNTTLSGTPGWPGQQMNNETNWSNYTFTLPNGVSSNDIGVVFNNGNGQQTVDLTRGTDGWFRITGSSNGKSTGVWSDNCPTNCTSSRGSVNSTSELVILDNVSIAPNPIRNNSNLYISTSKKGILKISISNLLGQTKVIFNEEKGSGNHQIQLSNKDFGAKGIYIINTTLNDAPISKPIKVIKQ
ncbi:putative secreted protein (Por secretion system target) [Tenacibaculum skagerrakense]|uniref:Putative secreted protein (Por secretion system target) n=1 Tax=Tenacibaculum skagerrakense TaxID=186571 RepID=A0A4R2NS87_9FLAO|nr:starch-binding protein [Tenacibaculum skagerrakense]TCP24740.1 putative secreted protein (Por secretion system target) [Tenacibaculum skagerrakense]